ncbi:MAG: hypothetical protein IT365_04415 [Candidatus Hydrogenedentes bacterium]|nr:hypothetical protein [Candidatus Hydrogenedentota bacterium]
MEWKATVEEAITAIAEGVYDAEVSGVRDQDGQHGPMVRVEFTLSTDNEFDGQRVSGLASVKLSEGTKLGRWVSAILGHMPAVGEEITVEDLLSKRCRIVVVHKTDAKGLIHANVVDVSPPCLKDDVDLPF